MFNAFAYVNVAIRLCAFPCMHLSLLVSGSSGGGERRPEHHPSGGQGTQSQCQRTGPDALPGRSTALPVHLYLLHMCLSWTI